MKLQFFLLAIILTFITSCNTEHNVSVIMKKGNEWVWDNQSIQDAMSKKSKYIEKEVLDKLKEIQHENSNSIADVFCRQSLQRESYELMAITYLALGSDTLKFIKKFKINQELKDFKTMLAPTIKKRLYLIFLLENYSPKNELEAKIVEKIMEYSPCDVSNSWATEKDSINYGYYHDGYRNFKLHEYKIGPLTEEQYIYIKIFEENGTVEVVYVSDKEKGRIKTIFAYTIDYKYYSGEKMPKK